MMISLAASSWKSVAWVSVALSLKYLTTELPAGGVAQLSAYAAAEKAEYLAIFSYTAGETNQMVRYASIDNFVLLTSSLRKGLCDKRQESERSVHDGGWPARLLGNTHSGTDSSTDIRLI
jgi:hypothetical protein